MKQLILSVIVIFLFPDVAHSATEYATFESFYKEASSIGWILAAVGAIIAIFFSGGTASPIVVSIGSWIGGTMGLSGIAATNAGLALLGGGSIASGGFGIIGGTALITAALSFGTDVVIDYTIGKAVGEYNYSNLTEHSKEMLTLPLPKNDSGPDAFEDAVKILEDVEDKLPTFSDKNQQIIKKAITSLETARGVVDKDESSKNNSLLSLLYFVSNDYVNAKKYANLAIQFARESKIRRTLPAFIYATSALYEERFDFTSITDEYFNYAILAEPDNPLIPLLFSIYLDRMLLRFNDNYLDEEALYRIFTIMKSPSLEKSRTTNYTALLSRYFIRLKLEQQKISSLSTSSNATIKNNRKTLDAVMDSLRRYDTLIAQSSDIMKYFPSSNLREKDAAKIAELHTLLVNYTKDRQRLELLIDDLKNHQIQNNLPSVSWITIAILVTMILAVIGFIFTRKRT